MKHEVLLIKFVILDHFRQARFNVKLHFFSLAPVLYYMHLCRLKTFQMVSLCLMYVTSNADIHQQKSRYSNLHSHSG